MKAIALTSMTLGVLLLALYVVAWIALVAEHGALEAVRLGFTLWPGNVIGLALLALGIVLVGGGWMVLNGKHPQS